MKSVLGVSGPDWRRRAGILAGVLCLSAALLGAQSLTARKVLADAFSVLEHGQGDRSLAQVRQALEADLNQLAIAAHDYAAWDDAYAFAQTRDPRFIDSNLTAEPLANLRVDVVWMLDADGHDILTLQRDPEQHSGRPAAARPGVMGPLQRELKSILRHSRRSPLARLVKTPDGVLAVCAEPITPTGGTGAARGTLVFGRFVNEAVIERVHATSQLPVTLHTGRDSLAALPEAAQQLWNVAPDADPSVLMPRDANTLQGYLLLRDVNATPAAILGTALPRNLAAFGRQTGRSLMMIFSAVIAVFATAIAALWLYLERMGHARAASERRYRAVITQAHETMLLVDTQTRRILEANPAATATLGFSAEELLQMDIDELFYACDGDVLKPAHADLHAHAHPDRLLMIRSKSKDLLDVEVTVTTLSIDGREVISFVLRDVSARKRAERKLVFKQDELVHQAHHDMLTGLLNRLGLERRLPEILEASRRDGLSSAFLYIDVDHFKKINDLRGHACGDKLLQVAAERLRRSLSSEDLIVRMGGDEFVVIAAGLRDPTTAALIASRIRENMNLPFDVDALPLQVTASIGVSVFPKDGADYDTLLKNADIALYESKEGGRDTYTIFTSEMTRRVTERLALEVELREAIKTGHLYLDYQPLVDLKTRRLASFEALVRWHHPIRGRIAPVEFIGMAERTGMICDIGDFVVRETIRQLGEWQRAGARVVPIAVNVSSNQLEQRNFVGNVATWLKDADVAPSLLRVEITESVLMDAQDVRVQRLDELRALGIEVSIDDFGTGYSSLAYLKNLPVNCLKIDRAFVKDIDTNPSEEAIVKAIMRMAHSLGLKTVAEGVETPEQARRLAELGANYAQGFYFSPPAAPDLCGRMLQSAHGSDTQAMRVVAAEAMSA